MLHSLVVSSSTTAALYLSFFLVLSHSLQILRFFINLSNNFNSPHLEQQFTLGFVSFTLINSVSSTSPTIL